MYTPHTYYTIHSKPVNCITKTFLYFYLRSKLCTGPVPEKGLHAYMTGKFFSGSGLLDVKFKTKVKRSFVTDFFVRIHVRKGRKFSK